jgi:hypothetical protein
MYVRTILLHIIKMRGDNLRTHSIGDFSLTSLGMTFSGRIIQQV